MLSRGGDFTSIQDAIDSITDASLNNQYIVQIFPGYYNENVVGKDYVGLRGMSDISSTVINSSSGALYTFPTNGGDIYNLRLSGNPIVDGMILLNSSAGNHIITNIRTDMISSTNGITGQLIHLTGGSLQIASSIFEYDFDGNMTGVKNHALINVSGSSFFEMRECSGSITVDDWDDNVTFIQDTSTSTTRSFLINNDIEMGISDNSYSGTAYGFKISGSKVNKDVLNNLFHIYQGNDSGTAYACFIDTTDNDGTLHMNGNRLAIFNFSNSHFAFIGTGDTLISHFDDITIQNLTNTTIGGGTYTYVNSPLDGNLWMNSDMHATYIEFDDPSNTYIGRDKTFPDYFAFSNDYTNFWLGYTGDRNIWMNYAIKADLILGNTGDTDIEIYNGTSYTELDKHGNDLWITHSGAGARTVNITNGDLVVGAGSIKADTFVSSNGSQGLTINISNEVPDGGCWQYYEDGLLISHNCTVKP